MSAQLPPETVRRAAAAIANVRGGRRGMPQIANVLELIGPKLTAEVLEDAQAVAEELHLVDVLEALQLVHEKAFISKWPGDERACEAVKRAIAALDPTWRGSW